MKEIRADSGLSLTKHKNPLPLTLNGNADPYKSIKHVGMILDAKLRWKQRVKKPVGFRL